MFRRPKKEQPTEPKPVIKCDFCKEREAIGKANKVNYCSDSICVEKWWEHKNSLEMRELDLAKKKKKTGRPIGRPRKTSG